MPKKSFADALNDQIANEFAAAMQYIGDRRPLRRRDPAAAGGLLLPPGARGAQPRDDDGPVPARRRSRGEDPRHRRPEVELLRRRRRPSQLALEQEKRVGKEIYSLFELARETNDYRAEQFMQWFVKEQVEEVSPMADLLKSSSAARTTCSPSRTSSPARRSARAEGDAPPAPEAAGGRFERTGLQPPGCHRRRRGGGGRARGRRAGPRGREAHQARGRRGRGRRRVRRAEAARRSGRPGTRSSCSKRATGSAAGRSTRPRQRRARRDRWPVGRPDAGPRARPDRRARTQHLPHLRRRQQHLLPRRDRPDYAGTIPPASPASLVELAVTSGSSTRWLPTVPRDAPRKAPQANEWDGADVRDLAARQRPQRRRRAIWSTSPSVGVRRRAAGSLAALHPLLHRHRGWRLQPADQHSRRRPGAPDRRRLAADLDRDGEGPRQVRPAASAGPRDPPGQGRRRRGQDGHATPGPPSGSSSPSRPP